MKTYSHLTILAAGLALLSSCSLDGPGLGPETASRSPYQVQINGEIKQQPATKVTTDGFCSGDEIGLYIVNYDGSTPGTLKLEDNQADNVKFSYDESGSWTSEYDVYYRDNDTNVDFYGYYPYNTAPTSIGEYPFEIARDQSKDAENGSLAPYEASDLLWAKTENITPTAAKVLLRFRHIMSSARVRFTQGSGWTDAAEFAAVSKAVLVTNTVRKTTVNLADGTVTLDSDVPLSGTVPMNDNGEYRAIVAPQTVAAGKSLLVITIDGTPHTLVGGEAVVMPAGIPHSVKAVTPFKMLLTVVKEG